MPYRPKDSDRTPLAPSANDPPLAFIRDGNMQPLWTQASHVIWSIRKLDYLDQMILNLYTDASEVEVLHVQDRNSKTASLPLNTSETLPTAYKRVFDVMSTEVSRLWSLNAEMSGLVNSATASTTSRSTECRALIGAHVRYVPRKSSRLIRSGPYDSGTQTGGQSSRTA